jgi:ATP-dependent DNA helicase RecG
MTLGLTSAVTALSGVGPGIQSRLQHIGIQTVQDLLLHLPYRYIDRTRVLPIASLVPGADAYIQGQIELAQIKYGKKRMLLCRINDGTGSLILRFFYFSQTQITAMQQGVWLRCWGQIRRGTQGLEIIHPEYQRVNETDLDKIEQTLTPVYPATEGLAQARLRKLTDQALAVLARDPDMIEELMPDTILKNLQLPSLADALQFLHRPPPEINIEELLLGKHPAQQRLIVEELLAHQVTLRSLRQQVQTFSASSLAKSDPVLINTFIKTLPFQLTKAQKKVLNEINHDLDKDIPMLRLIQGDVGSGKTVIAAIAAIRAIAAGLQVALMAPTELLADQHYLNFRQWLSSLKIEIELLTGKLKAAERKRIAKVIAEDQPVIVVGTHALFQEGIRFANLGLVIIDEQHRFGVHQRLALIEKGNHRTHKPHQLVMTATPIPRTLAMTLFAELDVSVIDELPPGRQPVTTVVLSNQKRDEIVEKISSVCREGHQVYWVCALIEESDDLQCQAATNAREYLATMLPHLQVGLIHGRMKAQEKEQIMRAYKTGSINLLVATTVIEVGVDVPNASLMIIENAERMGLAQLHQLRGRVGRGSDKSHCVLLYQPPLSELAQARLEVMRNHTDGFIIAEKDLELRGPGDLLGTRQTGLPQMRVANIVRDAGWLPRLRKIADTMITQHPQQAQKLVNRWMSTRIDYGKV